MQPLTPHTPQRHNGYIYATAQVHDVDCCDVLQDGETWGILEHGFEVASGDADDIEVANAYPWGSRFLVFSDGGWAATAMSIGKYGKPSRLGMSRYILNWIRSPKSHIRIGNRCAEYKGTRLRLDQKISGANRVLKLVAATCSDKDVLLRKRDRKSGGSMVIVTTSAALTNAAIMCCDFACACGRQLLRPQRMRMLCSHPTGCLLIS